jgi:hypothetical protein
MSPKRFSPSKYLQVFKPAKRDDRLQCAYLYADGHCLVSFERHLREFDKTMSYVNAIDTVGIKIPDGIARIVLHNAALLQTAIVAETTRLDISEPSVERGSENTRRDRIAIGHLSLDTKFGRLYFYSVGGLSSGWHPQYGKEFTANFENNIARRNGHDSPTFSVTRLLGEKPTEETTELARIGGES